MDPSYRLLFLLVGNRISIYRFLCLLFAFKFAKNANLKINFYKNYHYLKKIFGSVK